MIKILKEQLQDKTTNEALDVLYEMGIVKDKQIRIFLIKKAYNEVWKDSKSNLTQSEIIQGLAVEHDLSLDYIYKLVR